jgi:hypothetical protein
METLAVLSRGASVRAPTHPRRPAAAGPGDLDPLWPAMVLTMCGGNPASRMRGSRAGQATGLTPLRSGEGTIRTQPGKFGLGGGGLIVGRSGAEPVVDGYPGERPWAFVGGTIKRVAIDVSGEAFEDLAMEARAAFARQ